MWTAPRTWTTSEIVTSTIMNTHVRDNFLALVGTPNGSPPGSPALYDSWICPVSTGGIWEFSYRNDLDGTYPWHFLGGSSLYQHNDGWQAIPRNTWTSCAAVTIPRAGVYRIGFGVDASGGDSAWSCEMCAGNNYSPYGDSIIVNGVNDQRGTSHVNWAIYGAGVAANTMVRQTRDDAGSLNVCARFVEATPLKVA